MGSIDTTGAATMGPAVPSLADRAYETLRDRLIMLDIAPGQPIHESRLMEELGMGRTPVREALKRLESDHLVVSYPRRGTFAAPVDITELSKISEVRRVLEPYAARRAAELRGGSVAEEIAATLASLHGDGIEPEGSGLGLMSVDLHVHRLLYTATANAHLVEILRRLDDLVTRIWCLVLDRLPDISEHVAEHVDLLEAVLDGRTDDAERLCAEHVARFEQVLRIAL